MAGEWIGVGRARLESDELRFGGDRFDVLAPGIAVAGDEAEDRMSAFEHLLRIRRQIAGRAKEMMPPPFHIGRFDVQNFFGELSLLPVRDIDDAALRMD